MHICSAVVLSSLHAGFETPCSQKDFFTVCLLLLAATTCCCLLLTGVAHPETLSRVVKPRQGKPSSVIKTFTRTELNSTCHCCICDTSLATLVIVLSFQGDRPENSLTNAPKWPFLTTKSAIERARWLQKAQIPLHVMRICSPVSLSYLDANFESQ